MPVSSYVPFAYDEFHTRLFKSASLLEVVPFYREYFSGADISIYLQDIFIDEVASLQFQLLQEVRPIYGYASYTYDALAVGQRLIQGSFAINFREPYYLERKVAQAYGLEPPDLYHAAGQEKNLARSLKPFAVSQAELNELNAGFVPQRLALHVVARDDPRINKVVDSLKHLHWGYEQSRINEQQRRPFFKERFNIYILFGQVPHRSTFAARYEGRWVRFSGAPETLADAAALLQELGPRVMLRDVQITGVRQVFDISTEQPVQEEYTFIAKDLVRQPRVSS